MNERTVLVFHVVSWVSKVFYDVRTILIEERLALPR